MSYECTKSRRGIPSFVFMPKRMKKHFDDKILQLNNLNIVTLDPGDLELLRLKDLLDKDLIRPIYLT